MSICSEHQELEPGCPRCYATLPDDFTFKESAMRKVTIKVRPVTRYQVIRSYTENDGKGSCGAGTDFSEEFASEHTANLVADAIRAQTTKDGAEVASD